MIRSIGGSTLLPATAVRLSTANATSLSRMSSTLLPLTTLTHKYTVKRQDTRYWYTLPLGLFGLIIVTVITSIPNHSGKNIVCSLDDTDPNPNIHPRTPTLLTLDCTRIFFSAHIFVPFMHSHITMPLFCSQVISAPRPHHHPDT